MDEPININVAVWNMAHKVNNWDVLATLDADVALLSEATPPPEGIRAISHSSTEGRDGYPRHWSTAVASTHPLRPIDDARAASRGRTRNVPFENSRPGSWAAAVVSIDGLGDVTVISLYGLLDEMSDASVHRSLSEVSPIFDDDRYNANVLMGGDLNTSTGWDPHTDGRHLARDRAVLQRIAAYGLVDCLIQERPAGALKDCRCADGDDCTHTWTRLDPRHPMIPYQMDYLFASPALVERLVGCEALSPLEWSRYSDHGPIVATFET